MKPPPIAIGVFARPPVAGKAKTRLLPALGPGGTEKLQAHLIEKTLTVVCNSPRAKVTLFVRGDVQHPFIATCAHRFNIPTREQVGHNLGARMHAAFVNMLATYPRAMVVGVDNLTLTGNLLLEADEILQKADVVVQPAADGGYTLIGLSRPRASLFKGIPWGTQDVMRLTRERAAEEGLRITELPTTWDIDTPTDLGRALREGLLSESVIR
jgi:rSAM/selenodomain-associated transferase 1